MSVGKRVRKSAKKAAAAVQKVVATQRERVHARGPQHPAIRQTEIEHREARIAELEAELVELRKPMVHSFPMMVYHETELPKTVKSEAELEALGADWTESHLGKRTS